MLYIEISGGLGNQFYKYATAYALAKKYEKKIILDTTIIDTVDFRTYDLDKFNIAYDSRISWGYRKDLLHRAIINKLRKGIATRFSKTVSDKGFEARMMPQIHELVKNHKRLFLDGGWQSYKYFEAYKKDLSQMLVPNCELSQYTVRKLEEVRNCESVSIHIRRGDYVSLGLSLTDSYYREAIKYVCDHVAAPTFYVFSDDTEYCKTLFKQFENVTYYIVETPKEDNNTVADFYIMRSCKHNIIANSSYSWWAAYVNGNRDQLVIAPRGSDVRNGLYPSEWIIIDSKKESE